MQSGKKRELLFKEKCTGFLLRLERKKRNFERHKLKQRESENNGWDQDKTEQLIETSKFKFYSYVLCSKCDNSAKKIHIEKDEKEQMNHAAILLEHLGHYQYMK